MRAANRNSLLVWGLAVGAVGALLFWHRSVQLGLGNTDFITGYILFGLVFKPTLYQERFTWGKRFARDLANLLHHERSQINLRLRHPNIDCGKHPDRL